MTRVNDVKTLFQNKDNTVGVVRLTESGKARVRKLPGFWNKKLLMDAVEALDIFEYRDVEIRVLEESDSSLLLIRHPHSNDDVYIAVAGKTEAIE